MERGGKEGRVMKWGAGKCDTYGEVRNIYFTSGGHRRAKQRCTSDFNVYVDSPWPGPDSPLAILRLIFSLANSHIRSQSAVAVVNKLPRGCKP